MATEVEVVQLHLMAVAGFNHWVHFTANKEAPDIRPDIPPFLYLVSG
jgi:hypothetical protein